MSTKICQICGKASGIYPLCKEHLKMKSEGLVIKNEENGKWILKEEKNNKCVICGKDSKEKALCKECYHQALLLEEEIDSKKKSFELKDYYFNLRSANYRIVDKNNLHRNLKMMVALANIIYSSYNDTSLISRVNDDIKDIASSRLKKEMKATPFTEMSDLQKSSIMRTLDGHIVKSEGERIVDDILYNNFIVHCYEKDVTQLSTNNRNIKCDWFIPVFGNKGIYVEYWGMLNKDYIKNKDEKRKLYKDNNIPLIEIEKDDIKDVSGLSSRILREYLTLKEEIKKNM